MSLMGFSRRKPAWFLGVAFMMVLYLMYTWTDGGDNSHRWSYTAPKSRPSKSDWHIPNDYFWKTVPTHYPPASIRPLPTERPKSFPKVQASKFPKPTPEREEHRQAVKSVFTRCWTSYKAKAWLADEMTPVTGQSKNPFGGWGATLVDSLDTLWIMGMRDEFSEAVAAAATIDFTKTNLDKVNVFETTIRYLGGFLAAYDMSGDARLLRKAVEVGEMLYKAFDTPNRMPLTRWDWSAAADGKSQVADEGVLLAEVGSMTMEFTRLSLLTGEPKWFDAVQRITDLLAAQQDKSQLAGLWPLSVNTRKEDFHSGTHFTLAAMADSAFEYLPKMTALLGGTLPEYQVMYEKAADAAAKWLVFRPLTPDAADILVAGAAHTQEKQGSDSSSSSKTVITLDRENQHLTCYVGGMYALAGRLFGNEADLEMGARVTEGCVWAYRNSRHGIMPETFHMAACTAGAGATAEECPWDELAWKKQVVLDNHESITGSFDEDMARADRLVAGGGRRLPRGFTAVGDARYILRPEAIESVYVLYRTTGREELLSTAWTMFQAIDRATRTALANSAVHDVTVAGEAGDKPQASDSMESFWMGETLKYFYLLFSDESLVSLDEWVFNTEAHPFRRMTR